MDSSVKSQEVLSVLNVAFYQFVNLRTTQNGEEKSLKDIQAYFQNLCRNLQIKGTVLISYEGINGSLAGAESGIRAFQAELKNSPIWKGVSFKESVSHFVPFQRLRIKIKKEIIPDGNPEVQPEHFTAPRLSPAEFKKWLDEGRDFHLLDTRNTYEIEHGTFSKATHLGLKNFREFREKLHQWKEIVEPKPMVMFCTGGIRCEKASVAALQDGFQEVYQLDGGILKYFEEYGDAHYEGACFVFDERVALDGNLKPSSKVPAQEPILDPS